MVSRKRGGKRDGGGKRGGDQGCNGDAHTLSRHCRALGLPTPLLNTPFVWDVVLGLIQALEAPDSAYGHMTTTKTKLV